MLTEKQWALLALLLPSSDGLRGRKFQNNRLVVEGMLYGFVPGSRGGIYLRISAPGRRCGNGMRTPGMERGTGYSWPWPRWPIPVAIWIGRYRWIPPWCGCTSMAPTPRVTQGDLPNYTNLLDEPVDHGIGRSRGGLTSKVHLACDGAGCPLSVLVGPGPLCNMSELPDSPLELTQPKWKGRVGWAPTNASLQGYITALRLVEGEDVARKWLEGMVANDVQVFDSNVPVRDAIAKGEIDLGLINHYYVAEAQAEDPDYPVKIHFPTKDLGSLVNVAGVGVLASSKRKDEAIAFVRSMLKKPSQEYFADSSKEYPLAAGVKPAKELTPLDEIPSPDIDLANLGDLKGTLDLLKDTGAL